MSGLALSVVAVVSLWLLALTVMVLLLVRQVALLTFRLSSREDVEAPPQRSEHQFDVQADGPRVGHLIPASVAAKIPETSGLVHLLFVSATCLPCRKLVVGLRRRRFDESVVVLLSGNEHAAAGMAALMPKGVRIIRDPDAGDMVADLDVHSAPFGISIQRGAVAAKSYLNDTKDFVKLVQSGDTTSEGVAIKGVSGGN